jgi:drug/metabolite transporter (DMT)-like permease
MRCLVHRRRVVDFLLLLIVNTMWAAQYAAYKTASAKMGPVTLSTWTFVLAAGALIPVLALERRNGAVPTADPALRSWRRKENLAGFAIIGALGLIPASALLAWGASLSTASNASLIYLTVPIITCLLAAMILGERMSALRWVSLAISLAGVLLLSGGDLRQARLANPGYLAGNGLVLLACASSSFYNVYSKELLKRFTPVEVLVTGYLIAAAISLPLIVWVEHFSPRDAAGYGLSGWMSLLVLGLMSWGIAMVLWLRLLTRLDVSQASVSIYLLPFLGVLISALALGERITASTAAGGAITLAGTLLITLADSPRGKEKTHAA